MTINAPQQVTISPTESVGYLFDVDGPLVEKDSTIPAVIKTLMKNLLASKQTIWVKAITGRPTSFVLGVFEQVDASDLPKADIWGEKGLTHCSALGEERKGLDCPMNLDELKQQVLAVFSKLQTTTISYDYDKKRIHTFYWKPGIPQTSENESRFEEEITKLRTAMKAVLGERKDLQIIRTPIAIDIEPVGFGKYETTRQILRESPIPDTIVIVGDSEDDMQMLQAAIDLKVKTHLIYIHVGEKPVSISDTLAKNATIIQTYEAFGVLNTKATSEVLKK